MDNPLMDDPDVERLGTVYEEDKPEGLQRGRATAERSAYPDRVFYTLMTDGWRERVHLDLDRVGWQALRDLCDVVIGRIDEEAGTEEGSTT